MKITNRHNLPAPLYRTICWAVEKYEGPRARAVLDEKRISVTTLVNPPRLTLLRAVHEDDLEVDASELLYLVTGIAFHFMMAEVGWTEEESDHLIEKRIDRSHNGWIVSGQFDVLGLRGKTISDWKWTSIWSVVTPKFEWVAQLNLYRWLAKAEGYDIDTLETWAMLRDWSVSKVAKDPRLPVIPFAELQQATWDDPVTEGYIDARLALYDEAVSVVRASGNPNAVPVCMDEERWLRKGKNVRCQDYCDVAQFCAFGATLKKNP